MQFLPFEPGIEVSGASMFAVFEAFGAFRLLASRFLIEEGLGDADPRGGVALDRSAWYSQASWLRAFQQMGAQVGEEALRRVGERIPLHATFPSSADIQEALRSVDVAYHLNHRKAGRVMFDPPSGAMTEGIGHYLCEPAGEGRVRVVCENPYPCAFDTGLLTTVAVRHRASARVEHEADSPCRKHGAASCIYRITW